jgi:hypothetical protein
MTIKLHMQISRIRHFTYKITVSFTTDGTEHRITKLKTEVTEPQGQFVMANREIPSPVRD